MELTHFNEKGQAKMVEVTHKIDNERVAIATGKVYMNENTLALIKNTDIKKGDVLSVAQIAGIMGGKKTSELIPMCHPLMLTGMDLELDFFEEATKQGIIIQSSVHTVGKTGVEMEALTAVSIAALTIYDMCKAVDKEMVISDIQLEEKRGGKSGLYKRGAVNE